MDYTSLIEMLVRAGIDHSTWKLCGEEGVERNGFSLYVPPQDGADHGVEIVFLEDGSIYSVSACED